MPTVNLVLEITDSANVVLQQANSGGSGDPETIVDAQVDTALAYRIRAWFKNPEIFFTNSTLNLSF